MRRLLAIILLLAIGAVSAQVPLNVTNATYYQCSITQAVYLNQQQCYQACAYVPGTPIDQFCSVYVPPKPIDFVGLFLNIGLLLAIVLCGSIILFRNELAMFFFPEGSRRHIFEDPVYFPKTGMFYDMADNITYYDNGEMRYILTDRTRFNTDRHTLSSKESAFSLDSKFKYSSRPKIITFSDELKRALDDSAMDRKENAAMRERLRTYMGTDILGAVKEMSFTMGEIGKNVHPTTVMPMRRDGQNYTAQQGMEGQGGE